MADEPQRPGDTWHQPRNDPDALPEEIAEELKAMRQWSGLTRERVRVGARRLRELALVAAERNGESVAPPDEISRTIAFVVAGLELLANTGRPGRSDPRKVEALGAAYGLELDVSPNTLGNRRLQYSHRLAERAGDRHPPSPDTLHRWENEVIRELADLLVSAARGSRGADPSAPAAAPGRRYQVVTSDITWRISRHRAIEEQYVVREVQALRDGVDRIDVSVTLFRDPRPEAIKIVPYTDCRVLERDSTPMGHVRVAFALPRPLARGERHRLSYRVLVTSAVPAMPILRITPRLNEQRAAMHVQFDEHCIPARAWQFGGIIDDEIPWKPPSEEALIAISPFGYVHATFERLQGGLTYGIVWAWPD